MAAASSVKCMLSFVSSQRNTLRGFEEEKTQGTAVSEAI